LSDIPLSPFFAILFNHYDNGGDDSLSTKKPNNNIKGMNVLRSSILTFPAQISFPGL
jgi:hypothetical protein